MGSLLFSVEKGEVDGGEVGEALGGENRGQGNCDQDGKFN